VVEAPVPEVTVEDDVEDEDTARLQQLYNKAIETVQHADDVFDERQLHARGARVRPRTLQCEMLALFIKPNMKQLNFNV